MPDIHRVLIAANPEGLTTPLLRIARAIADSSGASLHVLAAASEPLSAGWTSELAAEALPDLHRAMQAAVEERLAEALTAEEQNRLQPRIAIRNGKLADEIPAYVQEADIGLVIVADAEPRRESPDDSLAARLVRQLPCSVLVVR